jgi:hypothetical protein
MAQSSTISLDRSSVETVRERQGSCSRPLEGQTQGCGQTLTPTLTPTLGRIINVVARSKYWTPIRQKRKGLGIVENWEGHGPSGCCTRC